MRKYLQAYIRCQHKMRTAIFQKMLFSSPAAVDEETELSVLRLIQASDWVVPRPSWVSSREMVSVFSLQFGIGP